MRGKPHAKQSLTSASASASASSLPLPLPPPQPCIDVTVHRMRHLNHVPRGILCLSASSNIAPKQQVGQQHGRRLREQRPMIAVSREGGTVDLLDPEQKYVAVATVPGLRTREVDAMAWLRPHDPHRDDDYHDSAEGDGAALSKEARGGAGDAASTPAGHRVLLGASRDGTVFVVDFASQRHDPVVHPGGGSVFCLAALGGNGAGAEEAAVGCEDGSVRVVRVTTGGGGRGRGGGTYEVEVVSTLPTTGAPILSVAHDPNLGCLFAGCADGTVRIFARGGGGPATGRGRGDAPWRAHPLNRITLETRGRSVPTRPWSLLSLPSSNTLVVGDSLGRVSFYDAATCTLYDSVEQNENDADVLTLATNADGTRVFASGVDSRVLCIQSLGAGNGGSVGWTPTDAQRPHTHDVRSMCILSLSHSVSAGDPSSSPSNSPSDGVEGREVMVSGGADTKLCTYLISGNGFRRRRPRKIFPWPNTPVHSPLRLARRARVLVMMRNNRVPSSSLKGEDVDGTGHDGCSCVDLYRLSDDADVTRDGDGGGGPRKERHLGSIWIQSDSNLSCVDISPDGDLLAACDASGLMLFRLRYEYEDGDVRAEGGGEDGTGRFAVVAGRVAGIPEECRGGPCGGVQFSPAETGDNGETVLVCATSRGPIVVLGVRKADEDHHDGQDDHGSDKPELNVKVMHTFTEHLDRGKKGDDGKLSKRAWRRDPLYPMNQLALSSDGAWLAAGRYVPPSLDPTHRRDSAVHVFALPLAKGGNQSSSSPSGSFRHHWSLPHLGDSSQTALSFSAGDDDEAAALVVAVPSCMFYIFDLEDRCLSEWSRDAGGIPAHNQDHRRDGVGGVGGGQSSLPLPTELSTRRTDYPTVLAFDPATPHKFLLGAHQFFCVIDLDRPIPQRAKFYPEDDVLVQNSGGRERKRARTGGSGPGGRARSDSTSSWTAATRAIDDGGGDSGATLSCTNTNCTMCVRYKNIMFLDFVAKGELVVVEQPWLAVVNALPDALARRAYGT